MKSTGFVKILAIGCFTIGFAASLWVVHGVVSRFVYDPSSPGQASPAGETGVRTATLGKKVDYDVDRIIAAHLFGVAARKKTADSINAPETKLQLSLTGSMSSPNEDLARAMIAVNRGKIKSYRVGQQIEGTDAIVSAIQPSNVLLDRSGNLERLPMKRQSIAGLSPGVRDGQ